VRIVGFFLYVLPVMAFSKTEKVPPVEITKIYQLDLFSLISFGLAITALIVSIFMAWLSWEFYKKSSQTSETTNETVTRIDASIVGIQNDISEIVQRAVGHWINGNGDSNLSEIKSEFQDKLSDLEEKLQQGDDAGSPDVAPEIAALKDQMLELNKGMREAQVKALFPSIKEDTSPIEVSQNTIKSEEAEQEGQVIVTLNKPMKYATGTGKFVPRFVGVPEFEVELVGSPYEKIEQVKYSHGVGKPTDFNLHLNGNGELLKAGDYVFKYKAQYVA